MFDFNGVDAPKNEYIQPGYRKLKIAEVTYGTSKQKGTPYMRFKLENAGGKFFNSDFYIVAPSETSKGTLGTIQYLHENLLGGKLTEKFASAEGLANYFAKEVNKTKFYNFRVDGKQVGDKVYCQLGLGFLYPDGTFVERDFTATEASRYVKADAEAQRVAQTEEPVILS